MWFIGVEVEQETSAPPPKKNPGSAPETVFGVIRYFKYIHIISFTITLAFTALQYFATFQIVA